MEKVIYNLVFNRKKRLNAEGKALIQVEAYLNRQKKYFSTKIYVKPTQWDSKRKAVRNHPNMDELNQYIEDYITYLERIELDMVQSGRPFSLKYLRERGDFESVSSSFVSFILKSATKLFSVLLASKRPLITELADKLRLKYPLLPTISPCPTMRLEAIRSIIPISCRRYPKSV
mgnify:CR=1 FL=1